MRPAIYILPAILSLAFAILCFGNLLASCSGHPPTTAIGIWIMPLSLLGVAVFLYLSIFFWKARHPHESGLLKKEAKLLPKRVFVFFVSFVIGTIAYILLMIVMLLLAINTTLPDWTAYVFYGLFAFIAIYVGVTVYKKFVKRFPSIQNSGESV